MKYWRKNYGAAIAMMTWIHTQKLHLLFMRMFDEIYAHFAEKTELFYLRDEWLEIPWH